MASLVYLLWFRRRQPRRRARDIDVTSILTDGPVLGDKPEDLASPMRSRGLPLSGHITPFIVSVPSSTPSLREQQAHNPMHAPAHDSSRTSFPIYYPSDDSHSSEAHSSEESAYDVVEWEGRMRSGSTASATTTAVTHSTTSSQVASTSVNQTTRPHNIPVPTMTIITTTRNSVSDGIQNDGKRQALRVRTIPSVSTREALRVSSTPVPGPVPISPSVHTRRGSKPLPMPPISRQRESVGAERNNYLVRVDVIQEEDGGEYGVDVGLPYRTSVAIPPAYTQIPIPPRPEGLV